MSDSATGDDFEFTQPPSRPPLHAAEEGYGRALKISFGIHIAFLALVIFKSLVFPGQSKPYVPTLRVDMVDLPDVLKKDLVNAPPSASSKQIAEALKSAEADAKKIKPVKLPDTPKEEASPDDLGLKPKKAKPEAKPAPKTRDEKPAGKPDKKKMSSALDRIKALAKIESESKSENAATGAIIKGNKISKGASLSGEAKEALEANYFDSLRAKLQENWELPVWISRQNLDAQVRVYIDAHGRVRSFKFLKNSGNEQFDSAIKKTLEESQPFPNPPEDIASSLQVDGIVVGFPL